jgi:Immunity protein 49
VDTWCIEPVDSSPTPPGFEPIVDNKPSSLTLPKGLTSEQQAALNAAHAQSESHCVGLPRFDEALRNALILHRRYWRDFEPNPGERRANDPHGFIALGPLAWATLRHDRGLAVTITSDCLPRSVVEGCQDGSSGPGVAQAKASLTRFELNDVIFSMQVADFLDGCGKPFSGRMILYRGKLIFIEAKSRPACRAKRRSRNAAGRCLCGGWRAAPAQR